MLIKLMITLLKKEKIMNNNLERRLRIFAEYLKSTQVYNSEYGGVVERAVEYAKEDTMQQIGQMLEEVLNMTEEQLDDEIN